MESLSNDLQDLIIPGIYPMTWLSYATEIGLPVAGLVQQTGLVEEDASLFVAGVPFIKFYHLTQLMTELIGDNGIGFEIGWRLPPTAFGNLGHAMLASQTARDALVLCQRYWQLITRGMSLDVLICQDTCILTPVSHITMPEPFRHIMYESTLAGFYRSLVGLIPSSSSAIEIWFDSPEPSYGTRIRERIPGVRFGMPIVQIRIPSAFLDIPLPLASVTGLRTALEQCDAEEKILQLQGKLILKVQNKLRFSSVGYPSLEAIADGLNVSSRTLRRRLSKEGSNYAKLLETARQRDAIQLLDNSTLTVSDAARLLGYADPANFVRAFKRWTGLTPLQYRKINLNSVEQN